MISPLRARCRALHRLGRGLAGVWLAAACLSGQAAPRIVELTAEQLTARLAPAFPQRRCLTEWVCATVRDPRVFLEPDNPRLIVEALVLPQLAGQAMADGLIEMAARPHYEPASGDFRLRDPVVTRVEFPGLPPESAGLIDSLVRPLLADLLARTPIWALDESEPQQALLRLVLQEVRVRNGRLQLVLGQ